MPRRRGQDNLLDILILINGRIPSKSREIFENQKKVIEFMKNKKPEPTTRQELEKELQMEFSKHKKGSNQYEAKRQRFYRVLSPLIQNIIVNDRENLTYELSGIKFTTRMSSIVRTGKEMFG